jgi:ElaB/YqjD/DUF883 family membrane-anchored ribosome-binding protein
MKSKSIHKTISRHAKDGATFDTVIESAKQTGRDARDAAMHQFVEPTLQAVRHKGHQLEQGLHDTMDYMGGRLKQMESRATNHPMSTLACAIGAGVLIGLWLGRK